MDEKGAVQYSTEQLRPDIFLILNKKKYSSPVENAKYKRIIKHQRSSWESDRPGTQIYSENRGALFSEIFLQMRTEFDSNQEMILTDENSENFNIQLEMHFQ